MRIRFQRSIRPVGQGAFYTEHFQIDDQSISVVYDCGTTTCINGNSPEESIAREIHNTFEPDTEIEYVFISHFDEDHCNGVIELCRHCKVKTLVIPLVSELEWHLWTSGPNSFVKEMLAWMRSGSEEVPSIVTVHPLDEAGENYIRPHYMEFDNTKPWSSGVSLPIGTATAADRTFWQYIPFNFSFVQRHEKLKKALEVRGINVESIMKGNPGEITSHFDEVREALDSVKGSRNANSMCVLSMRLPDVIGEDYCRFDYEHRFYYWLDSNCLYTGDYEAGGKFKLRELLDRYARVGRLGSLQLPHHGSYHNFSSELVDELSPRLCFVSSGFKNSYQHPNGSVVRYVLQKDILFAIVNEFPGTARYWNWDLCLDKEL